MKNFNSFLVYVLLLFFCSGCENGGFDCVQKAGSEVTKGIETSSFHSINAYQGINVIIKQGNTQEITLQAGENLIQEITVEVDQEGFLNIKNENNCNWVRSYSDINLYITTDTLVRINQYGYGSIRSDGVFTFPSITINAKDGVGDVTLEVDNQKLYLVSNTIANFYLSGLTEEFIIGNYYSNGRFLAKDLVAKKAIINHLGSNTIEVNATESLSGSIQGVGDIIYYGDPEVLAMEVTGKGELIKR